MQHRFGRVHHVVEETGWPIRLMASIGFSGFLAAMALISFPVPWTPVPFSMMPFGLLIAGAYQRPIWGLLSVVIYLAAAGLGAPIFQGGDSGWHHFGEYTAGYLIGFMLVSPLIGYYMQQRRGMLPTNWVYGIIGVFGVAVIAGISTIIWMMSTGSGISGIDSDVAGWNHGRSTLWVLLFLVVASTALAITFLRRYRQQRQDALNLFLVMLGTIIVMQTCGVIGLWLITDLSLIHSVILGSLVFLPFDVLKSGLAVALSLPFVPPVNHD